MATRFSSYYYDDDDNLHCVAQTNTLCRDLRSSAATSCWSHFVDKPVALARAGQRGVCIGHNLDVRRLSCAHDFEFVNIGCN